MVFPRLFPAMLLPPGWALVSLIALVMAIATPVWPLVAEAQSQNRRALTLRADVQQANAVTGVVTARGNVQLNYPGRQIQATAAQAQYFSRERRIVLTGNVYVLQQGNSLRADTVTYLIDEGRFVALPQRNRQVEAVILIPDNQPAQESSP